MNSKFVLLFALLLLSPLRIFAADEAITGGAHVRSLKITVLSTMLADGKELG